MRKTKVLVVDDSAFIREMLTKMINGAPDMEVVATANDPIYARDKIKSCNPDVITLDVEMPRMDGISFLKNLMRLRPMPVVMISTLTEKGAKVTMDALSLGAIDYVAKPSNDMGKGLVQYQEEILEKIRTAAKANVGAIEQSVLRSQQDHSQQLSGQPKKPVSVIGSTYKPNLSHIVAIGASTGGTEAIKDVLIHLPANFPAIVITQHIPAAFSGSYAKRMDSVCAMTVHEATHGQKIKPGNAYIAPGDDHLTVIKKGVSYFCVLDKGVPVNRHRPSVDVLFESVAKAAGKGVTAVLLTGMGKDGAEGLLSLKKQGCHTIIQDEKSSVVWGMPGAAAAIDAHCSMQPLEKISAALLHATNKNKSKNKN